MIDLGYINGLVLKDNLPHYVLALSIGILDDMM